MKIYRLEKLVENEWHVQGTYSERFIPQLASAIGDLYLQGFKMYRSLRITEVNTDAESDSVLCG